jgi:tRNA A-37 threonylcarbamoyl transferase component Bud32
VNPLTTQVPNPSSHLPNSIANGYNREIERLLKANFELDAVKVIPFSTGTHWVSIPLKVAGRVGNEDRVYLAKVVTDEGLHTQHDIITNKNARFVRNDIVDISFDGSASAYELLQHEALFLKAAKGANIFVPAPLGVFELTAGATLLMEFVNGVPLERVELTDHNLNAVFSLMKQLRRHQLVHGDIRRDNFLATIERGMCLIDYLRLTGNIERALDYDLMSVVCHLSLSVDPAIVLNVARAHFSAAELRRAASFLNFITRRLTKRERAQILQIILAFP